MDLLTASDLRELASIRADRCVSIYLPTHPMGREGQQDAVRLKNLVTTAEQQLIGHEMRGVEAHDFLKPILDLPQKATWAQRNAGLAIFLTEQGLIDYYLATRLDEAVIAGRRFYVKRLLPAIGKNPQFYILAISRNQIRLLKCTWNGSERLHPPSLPISMKQSLNLQGADRGEQVHSAMRGDLGKEAGVFHGQGGHRDTLKAELVEYFRAIDNALRAILCEKQWPLILAGVEYGLATFRQISDYAVIANEALYGGFDHATDKALYEQALPIAQRSYDDARRQKVAKCESLAGTELASHNVEEIVSAAHQGRIDSLLVDLRAESYGRFNAHTNRVQFVNSTDPELDLIELATTQTILHNGAVYAAAQSELPSTSPLCTLFRY